MGSEYFPGRNTPETWVGTVSDRLKKMKQKGGQNCGTTATMQEKDETQRDTESDSDTQPLPDEEEYTENYYSESEFHDEQEDHQIEEGTGGTEQEAEEESEMEQEGKESHIEVSRHRPTNFDAESHLLHIDFVTEQLEQFGMGPPANRRTGVVVGSKKLPGQQHNISFSRERVREIERTNQILLRRILSTRPTLQTNAGMLRPSKSTSSANSSRITSAALNRKKVQRKIANENEILLKKVHSVGLSKHVSY